MEFQVVSNKRLPKFRAGRNLIVFYFRKEMEAVTAGIEDRKTDTGTMKISSAALTALDLLRYPQASGGIDHVATVLSGLGGSIDPEQFAALDRARPTAGTGRGFRARATGARSPMARHRAACARARRMIPAQNIVARGVEGGSGVPIRPRMSGHMHPRPAGAATPPRRANVK